MLICLVFNWDKKIPIQGIFSNYSEKPIASRYSFSFSNTSAQEITPVVGMLLYVVMFANPKESFTDTLHASTNLVVDERLKTSSTTNVTLSKFFTWHPGQEGKVSGVV